MALPPAPCSIPGLFGTPGLRDGWQVAYTCSEGRDTAREYYWKKGDDNKLQVTFHLPPGVDPRLRKWVQVDDGTSRKYWTNGVVNRFAPPDEAEHTDTESSISNCMQPTKPHQSQCSTEEVVSLSEDDWEKLEDEDGTVWYYNAREDSWSRSPPV
eukprot:GEMP01052370.1.p1 GENE.GEMP01052370.1~~GEMP01052370.1.p1  ORF type:complete len:180 (+),score=32.84 GEMP01052370.1:77-541(+)